MSIRVRKSEERKIMGQFMVSNSATAVAKARSIAMKIGSREKKKQNNRNNEKATTTTTTTTTTTRSSTTAAVLQ